MSSAPTAPRTPGAQRVLRAASALFYAHGIHAIGVERIAEAAGVTKKTLYDRFGSKEQLVLAYLREREAAWRAVVDDAIGAHRVGSVERVLAVFDATARWHGSDASGEAPKGCSAINARAESAFDADADPVLAQVLAQKAWLLARFRSLVDETGAPDAEGLAQRLVLLLDGGVSTLGMRTFGDPIGVARATAAELLASRVGGGAAEAA